MSLNIPKSKTINNFLSKYSKSNRVHNYQKSLKEMNKDFSKKEGVLDYLKSFLTQKRPSLLKQNLISIKDKKNKNYLSTIYSKNEIRGPSNLKNISIFNDDKKVIFRNNNKNIIKQINSMKNKDNSRDIFYENNKYDNYSNKLRGFSPKNRYKLMKIYQSLRCINSYCVTKETNTEKTNKIKDVHHDLNNELNLDLNNDNYSIKKEKNKITKLILKSNKNSNNIKENKNANKNRIEDYKIESINSIQFLNDKKDDYFYNEKKNKENSFKIEKIDEILSMDEEKDIKEEDLNNNCIQEVNQEKFISQENDFINDEEKNDNNKFVEEIINKIKNKDKNDEPKYFDKYNKSKLMKNCLNKLFFDYSDGNYSGSNKHKYLNEEQQNKNFIINKEIILQKNENEEKVGNKVAPYDGMNKQIINKANLNQILNNNKLSKNNRVKITDLIENKEKINTENIKKDKDTILSLDNLSIDNRSNISNINKSSNKKLIDMISDKNQNKLNEMNKINFNLNYLYESKNYLNIQLSNDENRKNINNPKKINSSLKNFYKHSKLTKNPEKKLELLLDKIPRHENNEDENVFFNANPPKKKFKNNNHIIRRSKIIEFINKNSAIMPPNDYTASNQFISIF